MPAIFNAERCKGCGLCVAACPKNIVALDQEAANIKGYPPARCCEPDRCNNCGFCFIICPDLAVAVTK